MRLCVVIAAYDERDNVEELTRRLDAALRTLPGVEAETVFVVEGRDGTREILERLASELGRIRLLYRPEPSGLGAAFRDGFAAVPPDADLVLTLDADLNHQPEEIPALLEALDRHRADVVIGSRFVAGSRIEGMPLWKRILSGFMNRLIGRLFGVESRDKTSGFRLYRAAALGRLLPYRNDDYAFLPEMLVRARAEGLRVVESPIHFRFRLHGRSKMSIPKTSWSYLSLLGSRFRASRAAAAVLLAGVGVRLLYAFPVHKYVPDSDSLLSGLRAFDILGGDARVFYSYVRLGALESYMHAAAFLVLGATREAIALAPLLSGAATLMLFFLFVREISDRRTAALSTLFLALPSPAYLAWTYMPNGYPETLLFCAATLWLAARIARRGPEAWSAVALGLSVGLGLWNSLQTLTCSAPALVWLIARRPALLQRGGFLLRASAGAVIGAFPWVAFNVLYPLASFHGNYAASPSASLSKAASNGSYLVTELLPELTLGLSPLHADEPMTSLQAIVRPAAAAAYAGAALLLVALFAVARRAGSRSPLAPDALALLAATTASIILFFVLSQAGEGRGYNVRYILPLFFVAAVALGSAVGLLARWNRALAAAAAASVLLFHLSAYYLPWTAQRRHWRSLLDRDARLVRLLDSNGIAWICGNYWIVYPINFATRERILGVPSEPLDDHYDYGSQVRHRPNRFALVARFPQYLGRWTSRAALAGDTVRVEPDVLVFLPHGTDPNGSPAETLRRLRAAAPPGE